MRSRVGRRHPRDEQGAIAILTAFVMVGLMLCVAIVVDLGNARAVRRQSQNAADAASLAGANMLYPDTGLCQSPAGGQPPCITDAVDAAKLYALNNFQVSDWSTCTAPPDPAVPYVPSGGTSCISLDSATDPTLVRVYMPTRTVATFFGGVTGSSSIPVGSSAQAQLGVAVTCSLCFLGPVNAGNGDFSVSGGSIAVNGDVTTGPNSFWSAQSNGVAGTVSGGNFTPPYTSIPHFVDPLATKLTLPLSTTGLSAKTDPCSATATGGPGLYDAFSLPNSLCTLQPGLYVISGTWDMKNDTVLRGAGVTLYARSPSGYLDFKNGIVDITAPSTGVSAGYAIIYDRDNTNNLGLQGNGATSISGVVYAPASILEFNGNSCFGFSGGPIVLNGATTNGQTSCVTVGNAVQITVSRALLHLNK